MEELFRNHCKPIRIYLGVEKETDPFEHTVETTMLNPLPIKAIVTDLTFAQAQYKMPGQIVSKAKELRIEKKYRTLIEQCQKIEIENTDYYGWRDSVGSRLQIREEGEFIRLYVYSK